MADYVFEDDVCTPPVACAKPDCCMPHNCPCPDDEPCHFPALQRNVKPVRDDVEMPPRG